MRVASIHTSDRIAFKRCRRKWNWQSPLRHHLQPVQKRKPLWTGTGWHFVLEDFHGSKLYPNSHDCWEDYCRVTRDYYGDDAMPDDWEVDRDIVHKMLDYYQNQWLRTRDPLTTYIHNGVPQTEVNFKILIPLAKEFLEACGYDLCYYEGTIDRVAIDEYGGLWIVEYKTAKKIEAVHFLTDPQVTAYCWAATILYGKVVRGCKYIQWRKDVPSEPTILKNGTVSLNQNQKTTYFLYSDALRKIYGDPSRAPKLNIDYLNMLAGYETEEMDDFIRRDTLTRNQQSLQSEGVKILMEVQDMLNPDLPLYPNPERNCLYMCDFRGPCVDLDDGSDWEALIASDYEKHGEERGRDPWRKMLKHQMPVRTMETILQTEEGLLLQP